jgi:hypothetical protein
MKVWGILERAQLEFLSADPATNSLVGRMWFNTSSTLAKLADGTNVQTFIFAGNGQIVNADVNAAAAIAGTKIAPNFGAQNVQTTGSGTFNSVVVGSAVNTINTATTLALQTGAVTALSIDASQVVTIGAASSTAAQLINGTFVSSLSR